MRFLSHICVNDVRTTLGKTLRRIADLCGKNTEVDRLSPAFVKKNIKYVEIDPKEVWRIGVLRDMMNMKNGETPLCNLTIDEIDMITENICSN